MKSITTIFKKSLSFPAIWISGFYLFWLLTTPIYDSFIAGIIFLAIYLLITILGRSLGPNKVFSLIALIVMLPLSLLASTWILIYWMSTAGWLNLEIIYIPLVILFSIHPVIQITKRSQKSEKTFSTLMFLVTLPILAMNIIYPISFFPDVTAQTEFRGYKYYIVWALDFTFDSNSSFYKCKKLSLTCDTLYRTYTQLNLDKIIVDKETNEISVARNNPDLGLAFTYGKNSRRYEGYPEQSGKYIYQMATNEDDLDSCITETSCDVFTYTLYECNLDYTSCKSLPIQYSTAYSDVIFLSADETANEISATNGDDELIFIYGKKPTCYTDRCVILDQ